MIRESIESGTKVWSELNGVGIFKGWKEGYALVLFGRSTIAMSRKDLTEVEE